VLARLVCRRRKRFIELRVSWGCNRNKSDEAVRYEERAKEREESCLLERREDVLFALEKDDCAVMI